MPEFSIICVLYCSCHFIGNIWDPPYPYLVDVEPNPTTSIFWILAVCWKFGSTRRIFNVAHILQLEQAVPQECVYMPLDS